MKLKRILSIILLFVLVMSSFGCYADCDIYPSKEELLEKTVKEKEATFEDGAVFKYCFDDATNSYHICGCKEELIGAVYIPPQFNDKPITELEYNFFCCGNTKTYSPFKHYSVSEKIEKIYYTSNLNFLHGVTRYARKTYIPHTSYDIDIVKLHQDISRGFYQSGAEVYVSKNFFDALINKYETDEWNKCSVSFLYNVANIVFYYNNEVVQGRIFLVDNNDEVCLINKPTHDPTLEGYTFAGWYKEPECINAWDFDNDLTPALEYNGQGEVIFKETSLYAKWL